MPGAGYVTWAQASKFGATEHPGSTVSLVPPPESKRYSSTNCGTKLGGVLFFDAGNVWPESGGFDLHDLRYAVGPGLRYQTPIGPFRFDVGYQLNPNEELVVNGQSDFRRWRIHFSIGQAF